MNSPRLPLIVSDVLQGWLREAVDRGASDLHLAAGYPPTVRVHGRLCELPEAPLYDRTLRAAIEPLCSAEMLNSLEDRRDADLSAELELAGRPQRFRVNLFFAQESIGACFRIIPEAIPDFGWAGFPAHIADKVAHYRNGLVLLTGITGSGKTTTLAMLINLLNAEGGYRIITIEEPVEYVFPRLPGSMITQREVGTDVLSFADGLKYSLRQDPDVLLVGEIRDRETAQMALSAAETGHLVFSSLHTRDAKGAISRFADLFPQDVQNDVRSQLSASLKAVICQHLLPAADPHAKRQLALEILLNNAPIAAGIRSGKLLSIDNNILTGRDEGMINLDESVRRLFREGKIARETAAEFLSDPGYLG